MIRIYWRIRIILMCIKFLKGLRLGHEVVYRGKVYTLLQGVSAPLWDLHRDGEAIKAYEHEFRKRRTLANYLHGPRFMYRFYMGYWFDIWCREGIKPWMRACKIW